MDDANVPGATPITTAAEMSSLAIATIPSVGRTRTSRITRRLVAFCILASGIGVAAVLLWTRMHGEGSADRTVTPVVDPRPMEDAGVRQPSVEAVIPDAATALESRDANDTVESSEIELHDANEASAPGAIESSPDAGAADPVIASPPAHRHHRHSRPSPGAAQAPPAASEPEAPPGVAADAGLEQAPTPSEPARPAADAPNPQPAQATENPAQGVLDLFRLKEYAAVVDHCSQMNVTSDIANVCVLAACYIQASDKAKLWLSKMPGDQQRKMASRCDQLGMARGSAASDSGAGAGRGSAGE